MRLSAEVSRQIPGGPRIEAHLEVPLGAPSITVLFGPSGCGKTSLLRLLAGLDRPDSGHIRAADEAWFTATEHRFLPARKRRIGFVFQEAALFPHLTVAGNIAFGLEELPAAERQARVAKLVDLVGLGGFEARRPGELSGGQKQRVALARALAPHPQLLLLDEPFASLDRPAAEALRHALRGILKALGIPALLVTHDRSDALALGDSLILMEEGRVLRQATPAEVLSVHGESGGLEASSLTAVVRARCLGRREGLLHLRAGSAELFAPDPGGEFTEVHACIRAEGISLERSDPGALTARNRLPATLTAVLPLGPLTRVSLDCGFPADALITTWAAQDLELKPGDQVIALIKATAIEVVPIEA